MQQMAFTVDSAVRATGLSRSRIIRAIRAGDLKASKAGRKIVLDGDALRQYLAALPAVQSGVAK